MAAIETLEPRQELTPKDTAEHLDRQKERVWRFNPGGAIEREPARRDDAVKVGMKEQVLSPGVKNAEDADLRAEMLGIRRDFQQGGGGCREQQIIEQACAA